MDEIWAFLKIIRKGVLLAFIISLLISIFHGGALFLLLVSMVMFLGDPVELSKVISISTLKISLSIMAVSFIILIFSTVGFFIEKKNECSEQPRDKESDDDFII